MALSDALRTAVGLIPARRRAREQEEEERGRRSLAAAHLAEEEAAPFASARARDFFRAARGQSSAVWEEAQLGLSRFHHALETNGLSESEKSSGPARRASERAVGPVIYENQDRITPGEAAAARRRLREAQAVPSSPSLHRPAGVEYDPDADAHAAEGRPVREGSLCSCCREEIYEEVMITGGSTEDVRWVCRDCRGLGLSGEPAFWQWFWHGRE